MKRGVVIGCSTTPGPSTSIPRQPRTDRCLGRPRVDLHPVAAVMQGGRDVEDDSAPVVPHPEVVGRAADVERAQRVDFQHSAERVRTERPRRAQKVPRRRCGRPEGATSRSIAAPFPHTSSATRPHSSLAAPHAPFTTTSRRPRRSSATRTASSTESPLRTSHAIGTTTPPVARVSFPAASSRRASDRLTIATRAPAGCGDQAVERVEG